MIRTAISSDIPQMLAIYGPYVTNTTISFEYAVPTESEFTHRFLGITEQFPWLVWEEDGHILGYAYASPPFHRAAYRWCAEASIYLRPEAQGRGIGRKLYSALEQILTEQGYRKIYAIITAGNDASIAFHKAVGYRFVAEFPECGIKFGKLLGITWMEKVLISGDLSTVFPVSARSIVQNGRNFS